MILAPPITRALLPWPAILQRDAPGVAMTERQPSDRRQWFEERLEPLMDRLYGTALRLSRDPDDAEDIVAEAIGKAWARLDELRDPQRFEGWLFHILTNAFISDWRRRQSRPQRPLDGTSPSPDELDIDSFTLFQQLHQPFLLWWGSLEEQFFQNLLEEDLKRAIDALPDAFRVVIVLVEVQGYTYEEVSRLLGIPLGTVRSRLSRARGLLQKRLWRQAREAGVISSHRAAAHQGKGGEQP
ncbi:sigma-70 family RNA polymerase sigma factor [Halomonas ventosae]|uniref:RNA polymerase sigma-70 factor (ECF subfamily) n=1 Tax=Halomonas ventosae TaxID=229007 RepID=A0A2T0VQ31_9GAMM|nr:sigma-70 family RNA polymerase sigma factor [Halomonas ventosae]PRY72556.1 RNA polymerase sigma-70 factor (ECF subfamily) [Halomonas ventosae]